MADLDPRVSEFATTEDAEQHDAWLRAKVEAARADARRGVPHDQAIANARAAIEANAKRHKTA